MRKLSAALLFLIVATAAARAEWKTISAQTEPSVVTGLDHRHVLLEDSETGDRATIDLALFSAKAFTLRVIDQPSEPRGELADLMRTEKCFAGVNGGYFDPAYSPIGLLVSDGKIIAPLKKARLLTGVLTASSRGIQILRVGEFSRRRALQAAIECGPFLVDQGAPVRGLEATRIARRTFAATGSSDQAALGFCSRVSLARLAEILATARLAENLKISRALNLDGGSSSAFWFAGEHGPFSISEQKIVRDFVAVVPK